MAMTSAPTAPSSKGDLSDQQIAAFHCRDVCAAHVEPQGFGDDVRIGKIQRKHEPRQAGDQLSKVNHLACKKA